MSARKLFDDPVLVSFENNKKMNANAAIKG